MFLLTPRLQDHNQAVDLRIGFLGVAHMHAYGYAQAIASLPDIEAVGVWDAEGARATKFWESTGITAIADREELLASTDAVIICSENTSHAELGMLAATAGKHTLCEKPLVTDIMAGEAWIEQCKTAGVKLMTAFPCRYSPAFARLADTNAKGELGRLLAICSTNRGSCPFDWFVETEKSGGGAMIDHTVHVADLLRALLGKDPVRVQAQTGNLMFGQDWEDTAMLTLDYADGFFATLDSSWSRPKSYKTWGDVTMNAVFERGVVELDLFNQHVDVYRNQSMRHGLAGYGSDLDRLLVSDFLRCIREDTEPRVTGKDGLAAARIALAGYESARRGTAVAVL